MENTEKLIDSHCHLDMLQYKDDLHNVLKRAAENDVSHIITIATSVQSSQQAIKLASRYDQIYATIGVHPHDIESLSKDDYFRLESLYRKNSDIVVAYGEIGLDFFKKYAPKKLQLQHFAQQLDLAAHLRLPVVIHNRDADTETMNLLKNSAACQNGGIMHCFSGDTEYAKKVIDLGLLISIPGIVTYKNASTLQEVVKQIPLSNLIIETDGPYLAPVPHRGKRNEPSFLRFTAEKIAEIKGISFSEVASITTQNVKTLFNIS